MANGIQFPVNVVDNTKQGLSSAFNNTTKMTAKMAKKLVLEVNVAFPNIASKTKDLQSQLTKAFSAMGKIDFVGERLGKKGNVLGMLGFDGKELRKDMSLDAVKQHLDRLKTIQSKLKDNTLVSGSKGDAFKKEQKYIANAVRSLETYKNTLELIFRTNAKFNTQLTTNASRLNDQAKSAKRAANETARAYQQSYAVIDRARNRFARGGNSSKELADMRRYYQQQEQAARRAVTETRKLENSLTRQGTLLGRLKSLASRYFSIYTVINFGKKVAEVTGYFQQQQVALEGILGSASEAKKLLNEITSFALTSPFQTKELVQFTKQLSAFGVRENLFEKVKELADISTGLGVGMDRIILAYGQVKSATVLRGQELRQFTEAGIPMVEALAKKFTALNGEVVRTSEIFDMISKRQVSFDVVSEVLSDMTKEGGQFYKMQENITNTMYGQMQKLKDLWTLAMNDIGKSSGSALNLIIKLMQQIVIHGKSIAIAIAAAFAGNVLTKAIVGFNLLNNRVKVYIRLLRMSTKARMYAFGGAAGIAIGVVTGFIAKAVIEANKLRKEFGEIEESFAKENSKMLEGLDSLTRKITKANIGTKEYAEAVDTLAQNYGDFISNDIVKKLKDQEGAAYDTAKAFGEIAENVKEAIIQYNGYKAITEKKEVAKNNIWRDGIFVNFKDAMQMQVGYYWIKLFVLLKRGFKDLYERDPKNIEVTNFNKKIFKEAFDKWIDSDNLSDENFKEIIKDTYRNKLPNQIFPEELLDNIAKTALGAVKITRGSKKAIQEYRDLEKEQRKTQYYGMYKYFQSAKPSESAYYNGSDKIAAQNNREAVYLDALYNTISDNFKNLISIVGKEISEEQREGYKVFAEYLFGVTDTDKINLIVDMMIARNENEPISDAERLDYLNNLLSEYIENGGKDKKYINQLEKQIALHELTTKLAESYIKRENGQIKTLDFNNNTISEINDLLDKFKDTFAKDSGTLRWINEVQREFNKYVELKTGRSAIVSDLMEGNMFYRYTITDEAVKSLWMQLIPNNDNYEEKRKSVSTLLSEKKSELEGYREETDKDKEYINSLKHQIQALELLASPEYYNINKKEKGGAEQLPPELADFLSSLKNAYQRYNESVDKGGIGIGLNYVRTNEMFQEMFGEFFGGAEGKKFKALSGMKVGSHTVGELLSGKFLEGLEEGVIDFKAAALALAEDLEGTNIKAYKQAGKQLRQWVDSTISKDSLNATMNELEKTIKDLTNSFEKVNKEVDLYRKLQENGTVKALGGQLGVTAAMAATPDSVRMQGQIQTLISSLNEQLAAQSIAPLSLGSLSRIDEVYKAIENLGKITMMNNKAFDGTALGKIGDNVNNLLKQLLETLIKEAASISGEVYSGNAMNDLIANATKRMQSESAIATQKENIARNLGTYDMSAIKALVNATQEEAKKIFDQFMKENDFDVIARSNGGKIDTAMLDKLKQKLTNIAKEFPALLRDELLGKIDDLENAVADYNAKVAAPGSIFGAYSDYRNAGTKAVEMWEKEEKLNLSIATQLETPELRALLSEEEIDDLEAQLAASEKRLEDMGGSAEALEEKLRKLAITNLQKSAQEAQSSLDTISSAANSVINTFKSLMGTINKVWDIMSDGDVPEGLKDTEAFLEDFGDAFNNLIAPIMAVMAAVVAFTAVVAIAGTTTAAVFGALIAVAAIFAGVIAAAQQHDRSLQRSIEDLEEQIEDTQTAMKNLDAAEERMVGIDKFKKQIESLSLNMKMYHDALEQARLEEEKKNTDKDKVEEYKQNAQEFIDEFKNGLRGMFDEITGSTDELADAISSAMRSAFQSGENAARNMAAVVKENIGNIIEEIMKMNYLKPAIETAMNTLRGGSQDWFTEEFTDDDGNFDYKRALDYFLKRLNNEENVEKFEDSMNAISTGYIDLYNSLSDTMKDYLSFTRKDSSLSGGISGITEGTARTLEGLANSMLMQMILTNRELSAISQSGFAQVQVSWFNDMLYNTKLIADNTKEIKTMISDSMLGVKKVKVEMN